MSVTEHESAFVTMQQFVFKFKCKSSITKRDQKLSSPQGVLCTISSRKRKGAKHHVPALPDHRLGGERDDHGQRADAEEDHQLRGEGDQHGKCTFPEGGGTKPPG